MNSENLLYTINTLFNFTNNEPLKSSYEIIEVNNLKKILNELDDYNSNILKLTYDSNLNNLIDNLTKVKKYLLSILKISNFNPTKQFSDVIEKLDIIKLINKSQYEIENFQKLIIISLLYCKERKTFLNKIKELKGNNIKIMIDIIKKIYINNNLNIKSQNNKILKLQKDKNNKTIESFKIPIQKKEINKKKNHRRKGQNSLFIQKRNENNSFNKTISCLTRTDSVSTINYVNTFDLGNKNLDNDISISIKFDKNEKLNELKEQLINVNKVENDLKKELENLKNKVKKQNKEIKLYQNGINLNKEKIKNYEEEVKRLQNKLNQSNKPKKNKQPNNIKEFELISGTMYNIGLMIWKNKIKKYKDDKILDWQIKQRIDQFYIDNYY